ncbi:metallophosphoesterase [Dysgonomonas massiliensis]|uniref:metallophosphoesterase n=1 Tax=Dysgonomonas massiliensis TaxID=2040292 RepID=UPI000C79479E|nr:metallophosphoesterase [Dysgonomonas massiliensis]
MKKIYIILTLLFLTIATFSQQSEYQKPKLDDEKSWSMIFLPDVQNYSKFGRNQAILDLMMSWIEENIDTLNIKLVMCPGDLVEQNDRISHGISGNQSGEKQWEFVSQSFSKLDGKVPYILTTGNHDYTYDSNGNKKSRYKDFFPIDKNFLNRKIIRQNTLNDEGEQTTENAAYEMTTPHGDNFLFLALEFAPRDTVVSWAKNVVNLKQYADHRVVLMTHEYMDRKAQRTSGEMKVTCYNPYYVDGDITKRKQLISDANKGEDLWNKLINESKNIGLVLCGHISGESFRSDKNKAGKTVNQMLFDAQSMGGGHYGNGGDGWLRIFEFYPDKKTVKVKTFSPLFAISPSTQSLAWKTDAANEFIFKFD